MWSAVKKVSNLLGLRSEEPEIDLNKVISVLTEQQQDNDEDEHDNEEGLISNEGLLQNHDGVGYQNRSGIVTCIDNNGYAFVDSKYYFRLDKCPEEVRVGSHVTYVAHRGSVDEEWMIMKVLIVENESWLNNDEEKTAVVEPAAPVVNKVLDTMIKNLVGRVHERKGREVTVEPEMVTFNLDSVATDFIPIVGDWVEVEAVVQADVGDYDISKVGTGIVLRVNKVSPLRSKVCVGRVTHWDPKICFGTVRSEIFFSKDALDFGYIPSVGDQVVVDAIESNQCGFVWRALKVVAVQQTKSRFGDNQGAEEELNTLLSDKEGMVISKDCSFGTMHVGEEKSITVKVMNSGGNDHWLIKAEFLSASQVNLMSPYNLSKLHFPPGKSLMFRFKARARFIGRSSDLFVWTFESFKIGRNLEIDVESDMMNNCMQDDEEVTINFGWKNYTKRSVGEDVFNSIMGITRKDIILPGVRPVKNPSFIPVRLGNFVLPKKLLNVFVTKGDIDFGHGEKRLPLSQLKEEFPCLSEALNPASYSDRLHTLLFLEEIENIYRLNQFNIERGFFRHCGKFLSLCVEGLSEKRPSLIVGDRVIVSPCSYKGTADGMMSYNEGYIHKVLHNEILIQFNESFHQRCHGEYRIKFEMSRGNFVKCHQAVKLVHKYLKANWLFPVSVNYKPAQIIVTEENNYVQNIENASVNKESSCGDHKVKNALVKDSENEMANNYADNDKEHCIDRAQGVEESSNKNSLLNNNIHMENMVNDLNKNCEKESLSLSSSQFDQMQNQKCNGEKLENILNNQSPNSKIVESDDNDVIIAAEEGEEIKKVNQSLYSREHIIADSTNQNCDTEDDAVNKKVQLVFEHFKNTENANILYKEIREENIDPLNNIQTVEEVERLSFVEDNKVRKPSADKMATTASDNNVSQKNIADRMDSKHNNRRSTEEVERFSNEESIKVRRPFPDRLSTTGLPDYNLNQKNMTDRRGRMEAKHNSRSVEEAERYSYEESNKVKTYTTRSSDNNMSHKNRRGRSTRTATKRNERSKLRFWYDEESEDEKTSEIVYETIKTKIQWFNSRLNYYQKEAVRNVLKGEARPLPYVIFGPPGTGKTITLVESILQIYHLIPDSRLLIATPSNSSSDLISERLLDSNVLLPGTLTRLVGFNYMQEGRLPVSLLPYCAVASMSEVKDNNGASEYNLRFPPSKCQVNINYDGVVNICDGELLLRSFKVDTKSQSMVIGRNRITVGTCNTLGILYNAGFPKGHFTHVIIDEAGQGTEPELLIPLAFLNAKHGQSVLAGDPNQLGPVILSRYAKELGLGESFLVRLLHTSPYQKDNSGFPDTHGYNPHLVTLLINNYRSLPEILKLPSSLFYNDLLVPQVSENDSKESSVLTRVCGALELPATRSNGRPPSAILFHGIHGQDFQTEESPSWFNPHEIAQSVMYLQGLYDGGLTAEECGILTPYNKQAAKIRQMIEKLNMDPPKVGSVEEFQGQERMAIIMSSVRSSRQYVAHDIKHNMGFIACPRRLNVALTRARAILIIIGDPHLLVTDVYWKTVLEYCVKNDAYRGCDLPYSVCDKE